MTCMVSSQINFFLALCHQLVRTNDKKLDIVKIDSLIPIEYMYIHVLYISKAIQLNKA